MSSVQHLDLGRRKSFRVRFAAATHLFAGSFVGADAHRKCLDLLQLAQATGDGLWDDGLSFDTSLQQMAEALPVLHKRWNDTPLGNAWEQFKAELRSSHCGDCGCCGDRSDHTAVERHGRCIAPLPELLKRLHARCAALYSFVAGAAPTVTLATSPTDTRDDRGMLDRFGLSGWHQLMPGSPPASIVGIEIRDRHFDFVTALGLYYTFLHELICHAFQGIAGTGKRMDADRFCPWSEGWMDALAVELAVAWLTEPATDFPDWLTGPADRASSISRDINSARSRPGPMLDDYQCGLRGNAKEAFHHLHKRWATTGHLPRNRVTRFSIRLNAVNMPPHERRKVGETLAYLLKTPKSETFIQTVGSCALFADGEIDWPAFNEQIDFILTRKQIP
jgi:hypothetical protein